MQFGYFTLSDNHYEKNTRTSNKFLVDITDEALYADELGMHSAWIGEHHFNSLGVLSCPDIVLSYIASRTRSIRLAPAVTVLPLHHPIRVAEQWATLDLLSKGRVDFAVGRGYDRREYAPFRVSFEDNQGISSKRVLNWSAPCGRPTDAFRITASITTSKKCASHRSRCSSRFRLTSARSRNRQSSLRRASAAG
jgi:hypothetical protein